MAIFAVFSLTLSKYEGSTTKYVFFSLVSSALLVNGLRQSSLFFDAFIGVFCWLGFWVKFSFNVILDNANYHTARYFNGTVAELDDALVISSVGLLGFLTASILRRPWFGYQNLTMGRRHDGGVRIYKNYRKMILLIFVFAVVAITVINYLFSIYQRGIVAPFELPYGLNGVFKWLVLFGLASGTAFVLHHESRSHGAPTWTAWIVASIELVLTNVSLLSRGLIINGSAYALGFMKYLGAKNERLFTTRNLKLTALLLAVFVASVIVVNHLRAIKFNTDDTALSMNNTMERVAIDTKHLFLKRWVGIESVVAVSSRNDLSWELFRSAWNEVPSKSQLSFYDENFLYSPYQKMTPDQRVRFNHVSVPGFIAFCFYSGSLLLLFSFVVLAGLLAAAIEVACYYCCGRNLFLCALFAQIICYRYIHFGFSPKQSYLLFGALILNAVLICFVEWLLSRRRFHFAGTRDGV